MATFKVFKEIMTEVSRWYGKKLGEEQVEAWFKKTGHLPEEALKDIADAITNTMRSFPTPQDFLDGWEDWKRSHPEKILWVKTECPHCKGTGYIRYWRYSEISGHYNEHITGCGYCDAYKNLRADGIGRATKEEILRHGYLLENPYSKKGGRK